MRVYLRDYLSQTENRNKITSAFHYFDRSNVRSGYLIGLVSVENKGDFDTSNLIRFIWNGIVDEFSGSERGSIERLKKTIGSGEAKLLELIKNSTQEDTGVELDFALAHFVDDIVYFGFYGNSGVSIFHEDELVRVSEILSSSKVNVGSTQLNGDDVVFLNSPNFWENNKLDPLKLNNFPALLELVEKAEIELGGGVVMSSTGVDFEKELLNIGPEIIDLSTTILPKFLDFGGEEKETTEELVVELEEGDSIKPDEEFVEKLEQEDSSISEITNDVDHDNTNDDVVTDQINENGEDITKSSGDKDQDYFQASEGTAKGNDEVVKSNDSPFEEVEINSDSITNIKKDSEPVDSDEALQFSEVTSENDNGFKKIISGFTGLVAGAYLKVKRTFSRKNDGKLVSDVSIGDKTRNLKSWTDRYMFNSHGRKTWFKRTKAKISQQGISSPSLEGLKLGGYKQTALRKKRFMILGSIVLILIAGFIGVTKAGELRENMKLHNEFKAHYEEATELLDKAQKAITTDAESAEMALFQVQKLTSENSFEEAELNEEDSKLNKELGERVLGISDSLNKVTVVDEKSDQFSLYFDGKVNLGDSSDLTDIAIYKDEKTLEHLVITDRGNRGVYVISLNDKKVTKLPDPAKIVKEPIFVDIGVDGIYIYDSQEGVLKAPFKENMSQIDSIQSLTGVSKSDFPIDSPEEFAVLTQNDNLYLVDSETTAIYKSNRASAGSYGFPIKYFVHPTISGATDFFADFSTYVTSSGDTPFNRYLFDYINAGLVNSPLEVKGLRGSMGKISAGFTGGTLDNRLFLFDQDNLRIMVFEKPNENINLHPGQLLLLDQYAYRGSKKNVFSKLSDLVSNSDESRLYVLDGNSIWSIKIDK